jgi:polyisoprenoid-binding protein YceI
LSENIDTSTQPATATALAHYVLDPGISRFTVRVTASGMLSAFGHSPTIAVRDFSGEAWADPNALDGARMRLVAKAASLKVTDSISDKDRREIENEMQQNVLESAKFPEIVYECSRISVKSTSNGPVTVSLAGSLTLHGITRGVTIPAQVVFMGETLKAFGEFSLRQSDFNIKQVSAVGGGLKVKDEVKIAFDLAGRKQE